MSAWAVAIDGAIESKKPSSKDPSRGVVELDVTITNQRGEAVQSGYNRYMIGGR